MKSFGDMMKQAQKMQKQMAELEKVFEDERFEATAGGGMVKAIVDGKQVLKQVTISPEAFKDADASLLEDLIITAVQEAQKNSAESRANALAKVTGGMRLPM